jgi:hypothetical protein
MGPRISPLVLAVVLFNSVIGTCGTIKTPIDPGSKRTAQEPKGGKHFDRVFIIVLENQNFVAAQHDKYLSDLAAQGASLTNFKALFHPSYPNYLAMIGGKDFGVDGDKQIQIPDDQNDLTIADRLTWKNYAENYPACPGSPSYLDDFDTVGLYARKHVPFVSFVKIQKTSASNIVAVNSGCKVDIFRDDVEHQTLAQYSFYSPNLKNDGHDTGLGGGSAWLKKFFNQDFPRAKWGKGTLVIVTFDESEGNEKTNQIFTLLLGEMIKPASEQTKDDLGRPYNHYNVLRTIEDNFEVDPVGDGDTDARPITGIWK